MKVFSFEELEVHVSLSEFYFTQKNPLLLLDFSFRCFQLITLPVSAARVIPSLFVVESFFSWGQMRLQPLNAPGMARSCCSQQWQLLIGAERIWEDIPSL